MKTLGIAAASLLLLGAAHRGPPAGDERAEAALRSITPTMSERASPPGTDATATVYPYNSYYATGYAAYNTTTGFTDKENGQIRYGTNLTMSGIYSYHGWARYDVSSIPDGSVIVSAQFYYYAPWSAINRDLEVTRVTIDPYSASPVGLWSAIGSGSQCGVNSSTVQGWNSLPLNTTGCSHIGNCLAQDWCAFGFSYQVSIMSYATVHGYSDANPPYIEVFYYPPLPAPGLTSPADCDTVNDQTPTFQWEDLGTGVGYQIQVDDDPAFGSPLFDDTSTSNSWTPGSDIPEGCWYWRVRANNGVYWPWSGAWELWVDTTPPAVPVLVAPIAGAVTGKLPLLDWEPVADARQFSLEVHDATDAVVLARVVAQAEGEDRSEYQLVPGEELPVGHYTWHAEAADYAGNGSGYSGFEAFTVAPPWPAGWAEVTSMPVGTQGKAVKRGGWLTPGPEETDGFNVIYAAKGYKSNEFYKYYVDGDSWVDVVGMPYQAHPQWYKKAPRKGSKGAFGDGDWIYVTQGNNTLGFWRYEAGTDSWDILNDVPPGPFRKKVKGGTDLVYLVHNDTGYIYLLKGYRTEFYRYNVLLDYWQALEDAPTGSRAKWDKGSWLCVESDSADAIYAHKAKYHELYRYCVDGDSWSGDLGGMPFIGAMGRRKKSKDGGSATWYDGAIYALKGGNTQEFWKYDVAGDSWSELDTMPSNGSTGRKKRVKYGADIVAWDMGVFFALKGNKTLEFWRYVLPVAAPHGLTSGGGVAAAPASAVRTGMTLAPNPLNGRFATVRYALPVAGPISINVFDVAGRCAARREAAVARRGAVSLDLGGLTSGVYLVRLDAAGFTATEKLVIGR